MPLQSIRNNPEALSLIVSRAIRLVLFSVTNDYLRGSAIPSKRKPARRFIPPLSGTTKTQEHGIKNKHEFACAYSTHQSLSPPPPPTVERIPALVKKFDDDKGLREGQLVEINSTRLDREQYNGTTGKIVTITHSGVVYVSVGYFTPCFYLNEVKAIASEAVEVQA